jgi:hypothetical protein
LQLLYFNKEYFVNIFHENILITSLLPIDNKGEKLGGKRFSFIWKHVRLKCKLFQIIVIRGRRSRNKVSVDESADGSLMIN